MNSILKRTIKNSLKRSTAAHLFVKRIAYKPQDKHLSIYFYPSNEEWQMNAGVKTTQGYKFPRKKEFNLWFFNHSDDLSNISERELARTTLKMAYHVLPFPEIEKLYFEYKFEGISKKYTCELNVDFCATLISRAERDKEYNSDFLIKTEYK